MNIRTDIKQFTDIPNVGKATENNLRQLGFTAPQKLAKADPYQMYAQLCDLTGVQQDPCVIDVFISAVRFMQGEPARKWWEYTQERKNYLSKLSDNK